MPAPVRHATAATPAPEAPKSPDSARTGLGRLIARLLDTLLEISLCLLKLSLLGRQPADNKAEIAQTAVQVPFAFEWFHIVPPILMIKESTTLCSRTTESQPGTNNMSLTSRPSPQDVHADSVGNRIPHVRCRTAALSHTRQRTDDWRRHPVRPVVPYSFRPFSPSTRL